MNMRMLPAIVLGLALFGATAACGDDDTAPSPTASSPPTTATASPAGSATTTAGTVDVRADEAMGDILVGATGMTLYRFAPEQDGTVHCVDECASAWPPLLAGE